jgi:anti-sigma factor RsiW
MTTSQDDLSCHEFVEIVTAYLDDALSTHDRARFDAHLAECPGCTTFLAQIRETVRQVGRLSEESLSPEAQATLLAEFRDWNRGR